MIEKIDPSKISKVDLKILDCLTCISLCHNVTPTVDEGERVLQSSSPDEIALVNFTESMGLFLEERKKDSIKIKVNE